MSGSLWRAVRARASERGETLAELIVAIAIVGIVVAGLFGAFSGATFAANALSRQDRLRNELFNAVAQVQNAPFASSYTVADSKGVQFTVAITDQPTSRLQVLRITATVGSDSLFQDLFKDQR